jgi:hypothetical protein
LPLHLAHNQFLKLLSHPLGEGHLQYQQAVLKAWFAVYSLPFIVSKENASVFSKSIIGKDKLVWRLH